MESKCLGRYAGGISREGLSIFLSIPQLAPLAPPPQYGHDVNTLFVERFKIKSPKIAQLRASHLNNIHALSDVFFSRGQLIINKT
jgi:hypothetical protein